MKPTSIEVAFLIARTFLENQKGCHFFLAIHIKLRFQNPIVRYRNPFQASKSHFRKVLGVLPLVAAIPSTLLARVFGASFYSIFIDLRTDTDVYNFGTC